MEQLKAVFVGDTNVGKTSIFNAMRGEEYNEDQQSTVGGSCEVFNISGEFGDLEVSLWDTAGQERFRTLVPMYFRFSSVVIIVFDISKRETFENIGNWISLIRDKAPENVSLIICGNKSDLRSEDFESEANQVSMKELINAGAEYNALTIETSALNGSGIAELKESIAAVYFEKKNVVEDTSKPVDSVSLDSKPDEAHKSCC